MCPCESRVAEPVAQSVAQSPDQQLSSSAGCSEKLIQTTEGCISLPLLEQTICTAQPQLQHPKPAVCPVQWQLALLQPEDSAPSGPASTPAGRSEGPIQPHHHLTCLQLLHHHHLFNRLKLPLQHHHKHLWHLLLIRLQLLPHHHLTCLQLLHHRHLHRQQSLRHRQDLLSPSRRSVRQRDPFSPSWRLPRHLTDLLCLSRRSPCRLRDLLSPSWRSARHQNLPQNLT